MRYVACCLAVLVVGLVLDGLDVPAGAWLALLGLVALLPALYTRPDASDALGMALVCAACIAAVAVLDAVSAPPWLWAAVVAGAFLGYAAHVVRSDVARSGQIRIPPGYRFGDRGRR